MRHRASRRNTNPSALTIKLVRKRDGDTCVLCYAQDALQTHHRRPRGMGGTSRLDANDPSNLLTVCLLHHAFIEQHRTWALDNGLLVRQNESPADVAVKTLHGWALMTPDGHRKPVDRKGARDGDVASTQD